jgi:hypothetical protein
MANIVLVVRDGSITSANGDMPITVEVLDYDLAPDGGLPGYMKHVAEPIHDLSTETWDALQAKRQQAEGRETRTNGTSA